MAQRQAGTILRHIRSLVDLPASQDLTDADLLHRFVVHREEAAFAALVERHGRLVWGVCRHLLQHEQDSEDAFQATFFLLARRAGSIRKARSVASWLYGVAYRVAMRAKQRNRRQKEREGQARAASSTQPPSDAALRELQAILDEELQHLPEKYRCPFVLCCLEGRSRKEVCQELGCQEGTISSRIGRARRLLQARLSRRGVTLAAALCAYELWKQSATAMPMVLPWSALQAADGSATALPASSLTLAESVLHVLRGSKWQMAGYVLLGFGLVGAVTGVASQYLSVKPQREGNPSLPSATWVQPATQGQAHNAGWGEAAGGLRARIIPVSPNTDEQKPDPAAAAVVHFAHAEDVTFLVELKNVSDKQIALLGTRYGDSVAPPWPGKSVSDTFAPLLFDCEFSDKDGKPLDRPVRTMLDADATHELSSVRTETIAPGQSLVCLVRPTHWDRSTARLLIPSDYQCRVHYHGVTPDALREMKRRTPNQSLPSLWGGDVASAKVWFTIPDTLENRPPNLVWGPTTNGLEAAAVYRNSAKTSQARRDTATATFAHGTRLQVEFHIKNVSDKTISFWSETWRQDDHVFLIDASNSETELGHAWYSGEMSTEHWTLKPGQIAVLSAISMGIADIGQDEKIFDHPIGAIVAVKPGQYRLRHDLRFNSWSRTGAGGQPIPGRSDWQGTLATGATAITVRPRRAEDEPATFTARLRFQSVDGKPIESGHAEVYRQSGMRLLLKAELRRGPLEVPRCPFEVLLVDVRAPGFEETRLYDVAVAPGRELSLTLQRAEPLRFRLMTPAGDPVAGAKVRYFNRSKVEASSSPYPVDGLNGPIWATSNARGEVVLDSLQKIDPADRKLGNNIYWFYVQPPSHAPFFIGPVQAGQDLGKITVEPYLEVQGEVRGTRAQLAAFAAEWDQPVPMKRSNGEVSGYYAESKPLQTQRAGNKLIFHLAGLRPGTLRIVSRFKKGGKPISHEWARRTANEDDVVFDVQLTQSRDDLLITSSPENLN